MKLLFFKQRNLLRAALTLILVLLTSLNVGAADITQNSAVLINSGNKAKYNNKSITGTVPANSSAGSIGTFFSPGAIVVDGIELNLTIDGFNVDYSELYSMRSGISLINGATLHLTVKGTNTLKAGYGGAGISVPYGCTLEITATSTGSLNVAGGNSCGGGAGIGSIGDHANSHSNEGDLYPQGCGDITINGGTINAQGGTWYLYYTACGGAAGIGSSEGSGVTEPNPQYGAKNFVNNITGNITINGGTVTAKGGLGCSAIGGGSHGTVKSVTIMGGRVTANASSYGNAIGCGYNNTTSGSLTCPDIIIKGGSITANGDIGYGGTTSLSQTIGGSVTIDDEATVSCSGTINPSTTNYERRAFNITVYDASLTASVENANIFLPGGKKIVGNIAVSQPGIGTVSAKVLYKPSHLSLSGSVIVDYGTKTWSSDENISLSNETNNLTVGEYCYAFSGKIYDKRVSTGHNSANMTLGLSAPTSFSFTPEISGTSEKVGTASFSGYIISASSQLAGEQMLSITDNGSNKYQKGITFPAVTAHKSDLSVIMTDPSVAIAPVKYIDANGIEQTVDAQRYSSSVELLTEGTWYVDEEITVANRLSVAGTVNLILCNGCKLIADKGITVGNDNTLNIYGQQGNSGKLIANGQNNTGNEEYYTGIGGCIVYVYNNAKTNIPCGTIGIYGGDVTAYGGKASAGIGGEYNRAWRGTVNIGGGIVYAKGGAINSAYDAGAGIGGGENGCLGTINITGGTIHAESGDDPYWGAAGIGGGRNGDAGNINISGGVITAIGKSGGRGIGPGQKKNGGSVNLSWTQTTDVIYANSYGGTVTLQSDFMIKDTETQATTDNIGGKTIVPMNLVTFVANGGSGTMNSIPVPAGSVYKLPACDFTPTEGMAFYRWQIGETQYNKDDELTVTNNITLKALWAIATNSVTFNMNGHGDQIVQQIVDHGTTATEPTAPTADGYEFAGWYLDEATEPYNFDAIVTANITLNALWSKIVTPTVTVTGEYTYTGEQIIPEVTVKDGETIVPASEYTVSTKNTTKAGTATVTIVDNPRGNYKLETTSKDFDVAQKPVVVSGITAKNKVFDDNDNVQLDYDKVVIAGKTENDIVTVSADATFDNSSVGENKTVNISNLTLLGTNANNYVLADEGQQTTTTATIYAPHTVKFADENGNALVAAAFADQIINNGGKVTIPVVTDANRPVKNGYRFVGWNINGEEYDFDTTLDFETTQSITLTTRFLKLHNIYGSPYTGPGEGDVAAGVSQAIVGEEVTITATPDEGSVTSFLRAYYEEDNVMHSLVVTMTDDNTGTFIMPDKDDVHIGAGFALATNLLAGLKNDNDQYEVRNAGDLKLLSTWMAAGNEMEGETILLMNDIDVTGSDFDGFPSLRKGYTSYACYFRATFDGQGHTISGLKVLSGTNAGFIPYLVGTVKNLTLRGTVQGGGYQKNVGGIVSSVLSGGTIQNCVSLMQVRDEGSSMTFGGIAGRNDGTVKDCMFLGMGGIWYTKPMNAVGTGNGETTGCTALYAVEPYDEHVIISSATSEGNEVGGYFKAGSDVVLTVTAESQDGWTLRGFKYKVDVDDVNLTANGGNSYTLTNISQNVYVMPNYSYDGLNSLEQDAQNRYLVKTKDDLNTVARVVGELGGCPDMTFLLANDLTEVGEFSGIAPNGDDDHAFKGTFDGGGHTISGMTITGHGNNIGFVGYLLGTVQNLTMEYCTVTNTSDVDYSFAGMLAGSGYNSGAIRHCRVIGGTVVGSLAGAIMGDYYMDAEDNLYNDEVKVISGGIEKAIGDCGTSNGDINYSTDPAVVGWRVLFMGKNGQLAPAQLIANGDAAIRPDVTPVGDSHFTFANTWKRGDGQVYTFDSHRHEDRITENTILYPGWNEETKYTITYQANDGNGSTQTEAVYESDVTSYVLPDCFFAAPDGKRFVAWEYAGNSYAPGESLTFDTDIVVEAQWVTVRTLTAKIAPDNNYWTTFYCGTQGYKIDNDINACAYTASVTGSTITLHKLGKVIPANTAVIVVGTVSDITMTESDDNAENIVPNSLQGIDTDTNCADIGTGTFYVMGFENAKFGFHKYSGTKMAANKAFLLLDSYSARSLDIVFDNDETSISEQLHTANEGADRWYTIEGRCIERPTAKGLYIKNGRKVVIK